MFFFFWQPSVFLFLRNYSLRRCIFDVLVHAPALSQMLGLPHGQAVLSACPGGTTVGNMIFHLLPRVQWGQFAEHGLALPAWRQQALPYNWWQKQFSRNTYAKSHPAQCTPIPTSVRSDSSWGRSLQKFALILSRSLTPGPGYDYSSVSHAQLDPGGHWVLEDQVVLEPQSWRVSNGVV